MTALVAALTLVVLVMSVLVAGLLRSHATILRRLHELDGGEGGAAVLPVDGSRLATRSAADIRTFPGVPAPLADPVPGAPAHDLIGRGLTDDAVVVRTSGVSHNTVIAFLTSGCSTCQNFWREFADPANIRLPPGTRLVIVTKGMDAESPSALLPLAPDWAEVVMSSQAWTDFRVPGSPYVIAVDGPTGRVKGEGTGMNWAQVARLLAQATGDLAYLSDTGKRQLKPVGDAEREAQVDRDLLAAGILPGHSSLYPGERTIGSERP